MNKIMNNARAFMRKWNEKGQGLIEYVLIISLVALVVILALKFLGGTVGNSYNKSGGNLADTLGSGGG